MSDLIKLQKTALNKSLLYIDGDQKLQKNFGIYFKKSFQNFYQAYDGEEGFSLFETHKPDVVILNLELDKKDAVELVMEIKDIHEDIIMLAVSDEGDNYELMQTLDMGLNKIMLKPVGFAQIANILISLLPPPPPPKKPVIKKPETPKRHEVPTKPKVKEEPKAVKKTEPTPKPKPISKPVVKEPVQKKPVQAAPKAEVKKELKNEPAVKPALEKQKEVKKPLKEVKKEIKKTVTPKPKEEVKKTELELCLELIKELVTKKTDVEFISNYKGIMVLHDGTIDHLKGSEFFVKANIAQILAAKSEKQILIKTPDSKYIHAKLSGIDLKNGILKLTMPRVLNYKQRDKNYSRIMADKSFKASIYFKKKHVDFLVTYVSFHSAVLITNDKEIKFQVGDEIDITLGFNISGPNAMIKDKKFTKVFAKCEVKRIDVKKDHHEIIIILNVNKAGERTLKKYLSERETDLIYEFKSRIRR